MGVFVYIDTVTNGRCAIQKLLKDLKDLYYSTIQLSKIRFYYFQAYVLSFAFRI